MVMHVHTVLAREKKVLRKKQKLIVARAKIMRYTKTIDPSLLGKTPPNLSSMVIMVMEICNDNLKTSKKRHKGLTIRKRKYCVNHD